MNISVNRNGEIVILTPLENWYGMEVLVVTAYDLVDNGTAQLNLTVNPVNDAPEYVDIIDDETWDKGYDNDDAFDLDDYFTDVDNSTLIYSYSGNDDN